MLVFINPELMSINGETENRKNGGSPYYKISCDASSLVTPKDPTRPNNVRPILRMACNATVQTMAFASEKEVLTEYVDLPTTYSSRDNNGKGISVLVRELEEENKRDVYVIAFPFHGVLKPLPQSEHYDVLKGMIVVSGSYSIPYKNYTYKNILYLVVSPKGLNPDPIMIDLDSYCLKSDKRKGTTATMHEMMTVTLNHENSNFQISDEETAPVDMTEFKDAPVWVLAPVTPVEPRKPRGRKSDRPFPTRERNTNDRPRNNTSNNNNRPRDTYKKPENGKGGAMPSGGFAKSAPNHNRPKSNVQEPVSTNLDVMIENALNRDKYPAKKKSRH